MAASGLGAIRLPHSPIDGDPDAEDLDDLYPSREIDIGADEIAPDSDTAAKIEVGDGSVVIYLGPPRARKSDGGFDENLAEVLDEGVLGQIADDLLKLIDADNLARAEWLETRERGIELLGLKIEPMRRSGTDEGSAPLEGMSNVRATVLAEAAVRFGANAFAELCPADGPAKVTEAVIEGSDQVDRLALALEKDLNHYLLNIDKPWVADTDAMLLRVGVDGSVFKKIYHDPILRRPVSRAIYGEDLILDSAATSIYDAKRITHRIFMDKTTLKRMQIVGAYRKMDVGAPGFTLKSAMDDQVDEISGVNRFETRDMEDRPYELYEILCELDIKGYEHESDGKPDGLAVPYKVVVHKEARTCLEIRRNWDEKDDLCLAKAYFEHFPFIRGFGPYGIGLSHLLGNLTGGLTAAYREMIDAGMFNNFPGNVVRKGALRQNKNIMRVPPGGTVEIETGDLPIGQVFMPLPYKPLDAVFVNFMEQLEQNAQRLGGTAEVMVGEGKQDAPVGTTLALIEQAIKPLLATHKRLCAAQSAELQMLVERFREDPEAWARSLKRPPSRQTWDEQLFTQAIDQYGIVARADPNTASHLQRMLRNAAVYQMAKDDFLANPGNPNFNIRKVQELCLRGLGVANPDEIMNEQTMAAPAPPDPKEEAARLTAQADLIDAQTKASQAQFEQQNAGIDLQKMQAQNQAKLAVAGMQLDREKMIQEGENVRQGQSAAADARQAELDRAHEQAMEMHKQAHAAREAAAGRLHEAHTAHLEHQHDQAQAHADHQHALGQAAFGAAIQPRPEPKKD